MEADDYDEQNSGDGSNEDERRGWLGRTLENVRPDFLDTKNVIGGGKTGKAAGAAGAATGAAGAAGAAAGAAGGAAGGLKAAETAAAGKNVGAAAPGAAAAQAAERAPSGLYSGGGKTEPEKKKGKFSLGKISAGAFIVIVVAIIGIGVALIGSPVFMIGMIDYNLQKTLGFTGTESILEKQAEYITGEMLSKGKVPNEYGDDLAEAGINVGQLTANGDFVRTNTFIADIDGKKDIAAIGSGFQVENKDGELAVLFEDEVISADDFVAAVEANPRMYAAYSKAANIKAKYYYSQEVGEIYAEMGLSRHAFHGYESTGDAEKDREKYDEILETVLDKTSDVSMSGFPIEQGGSQFTAQAKGDASDIIGEVYDGTKGTDATEKAAQLLNSAVSANEPYKAAAAFMAVEVPVQQARIQGDGPVNEAMNVLYESTKLTYVDVNTGEEVTKDLSIIDTPNFSAAASEGQFSKEEAANFARDRVLKSTKSAKKDVILDTTVSTDGQKSADTVLGIGLLLDADKSVLDKATNNIEIAMTAKNSEYFKSILGGNRAVEGGAFISSSINSSVIAALPSDSDTVLAYNHEMGEAIARKEAAERATKNPFDISSPNTFLGSIAHSFAAGMTRNRQLLNATSVVSAVGSIANVTDDSLSGMLGGAIADGEDSNYLTTFGNDCETTSGVGSKADIYCTQTTTITTKYMEKKSEYWEKEIDTDKYEEDFVLPAMDRKSTVGVEDANVCEKIAGDKN